MALLSKYGLYVGSEKVLQKLDTDKQAMEIAKMLRDIAAGLVSAATLMGAGFIIGAFGEAWVLYDAKQTGAKEERSKCDNCYKNHYEPTV